MVARGSNLYNRMCSVLGVPEGMAVGLPRALAEEVEADGLGVLTQAVKDIVAETLRRCEQIGASGGETAQFVTRAICAASPRRMPRFREREYSDSVTPFRAFFVVSSVKLSLGSFRPEGGTVAVTRIRGGACRQSILHFHYVFTTDHFISLSSLHIPPELQRLVSVTGVRRSTRECVAYIKAQLVSTDGTVGGERMTDEARPGHEADEYFARGVREYTAEEVARSMPRPLGLYETRVTRQDLGMRHIMQTSVHTRPAGVSAWRLRMWPVNAVVTATYAGQYYIVVAQAFWEEHGDEEVIRAIEQEHTLDRARAVMFEGRA